MPDLYYMRECVRRAYPGPRWAARVRGMSDNQVMAIYFRFEREGWPNKKLRAQRLSQLATPTQAPEDYFVVDRTGTPHVVVATQPDNSEEVKQLCFFGYGGAIELPGEPT